MSADDAIVTACWTALKDYGSYVDPDAFRAALSAAGWVVVPVEPTPRMVDRGLVRADIDWRAASEDEALSDDEARRIYRAMIAAAQEDQR